MPLIIRGRIPGRGYEDDRPERALLAAILLQAVKDTHAGDLDARRWLDTIGGDLARDVFGLWGPYQARRSWVRHRADR
jgi:hypothetical protein